MNDWNEMAKDAMKRRGMTHAHLARELRVHRSTVGNWMTGRSTPGNEIIDRISIALGIELPRTCNTDHRVEQERELLAVFRRMSHAERSALLDALKKCDALPEHAASTGNR